MIESIKELIKVLSAFSLMVLVFGVALDLLLKSVDNLKNEIYEYRKNGKMISFRCLIPFLIIALIIAWAWL